jgi:hypothetical protein
MSSLHEENRGVSEALLDRLVDGELEEQERRECLARLEADPAGWRRCALAFLEAQAWRSAIGDLAEAAIEPRTSAVRTPLVHKRRSSAASHWIALAATALLAFTLGWRFGPKISDQTNIPKSYDAISTETRTGEGPVDQKDHPERAYYDEYDLATMFALEGRRGSITSAAADGAPGSAGAGMTRLSGPLDYSQGALLRQGYSLERQQGFVPIGLEDGRQLAVPVEQVQVRFTGSHAY